MNYLNCSSTSNAVASDAGLQLNNVEILYSKLQKVYIKPEHKEERQTDLRVNLEIHAGISPVCRKSLCLLFSDDHDPCFLYSLFITEDDFKILKSQQGLLVDFDNFATHLIYLLEQCHVPFGNNGTKMPKFLMLLAEESGNWTFRVVETNNFKHLCHLSLNVCPANDADVKTHMAMKIKQLQENAVHKDRDLSIMENKMKDVLMKLEIKTKDLEEFEQKYIAEKTEFEMTLKQQTSMEQEKFSQARMEWSHALEKETMRLEQKHSDVINQLQSEIEQLSSQNKNFREKQAFLDSNQAEQSKQLQHLEQELALAQRELSHVKKQNSKLDIEYQDKDKNVHALKTRVAVLEQEIKDKSILMNKNTEMLKIAKEQKQQLEEFLSEKEEQLQRKQTTLKKMSDDLIKANEILSKLQTELVSTKSKLKLRTGIALEQERLLNDKDKEFSQMELKISSLEKEAQDVKNESESLRGQIKVLELQIEEKNQTIKKNEDVINFLNRRVNETNVPIHSSCPISSNQPIQLTLPSKFLPSRLGTTGINSVQNQTSPMGNLQINGLSEGISSASNFNKPGKISSTSTPLDRINSSTSKFSASNSRNLPVIVNDQHLSSGEKIKVGSGIFQGGLRRANVEKAPLPSAYFPNTRPSYN